MQNIHSVTQTFAALAEPNRLRIVELLRSGPRTVNDISDRLRLRQPQASKHLRVLKEVGLVDAEVRGHLRIYALRTRPLQQMHEWLDQYRRLWEESFEQLDEVIDELAKKEKKNEHRKPK